MNRLSSECFEWAMPPSTPPAQKLDKYNVPRTVTSDAKQYLSQLVDQSATDNTGRLPANVLKWATKGSQQQPQPSNLGPHLSPCKGIYTWISSPRTVYNPRKYLRHYQKWVAGSEKSSLERRVPSTPFELDFRTTRNPNICVSPAMPLTFLPRALKVTIVSQPAGLLETALLLVWSLTNS